MYGLYFHIPFCLKKCKYCDFVSFDDSNLKKDAYLDALFNEMEEYKGEKADTVFIGGGTPTSLSMVQLEKLLTKIRESFIISKDAEFTIEANPKTLDAEKLSILKKYGVNRISVGVQSFCNDELLKIGRVHTAEEAIDTVELIKKSGFENFSIDLMSALPGQRFESFKKNLETAVAINPKHISCYSLIIEENTPLFEEFNRGMLKLPDEDTERKMYDYACEFLHENGYSQYEISNFSKNGYESKHNIKYWECREYIGMGLAAHSYYKGERFSNVDNLSEYINGKYHMNNAEKLTLKDKIEEFMIMGLRMTKGISKKEFFHRFGMEPEQVYKKELERFLNTGFLQEKDGNIFLSPKGVSVSNSIMCEFAVANLKING